MAEGATDIGGKVTPTIFESAGSVARRFVTAGVIGIDAGIDNEAEI